jgi:hypothetical protein
MLAQGSDFNNRSTAALPRPSWRSVQVHCLRSPSRVMGFGGLACANRISSNCSVLQSGTVILSRPAFYIYETLRGLDDSLHACSAKWFHPGPLGLVETISSLNKSHPPPPPGRLDDQCLRDGLSSELVPVQPLCQKRRTFSNASILRTADPLSPRHHHNDLATARPYQIRA